jgi:AMMECR1 domain-containing protein
LGKDAVYLRYHSLSAFMQPSVAREHGYTKKELLDAVSVKAGLKAGMWQNPAVELYRARTCEHRRHFFATAGE